MKGSRRGQGGNFVCLGARSNWVQTGGNGTFELETKRVWKSFMVFPVLFLEASASDQLVAINVNYCSCMRFSRSTPCLRFASQSTLAALASKIFLAVSPSKLSQAYNNYSFLIDAKPLHPYHCKHLLQICMKPELITLVKPILSAAQSIITLQNNRQIKLVFTKC